MEQQQNNQQNKQQKKKEKQLKKATIIPERIWSKEEVSQPLDGLLSIKEEDIPTVEDEDTL